MMNDIDDGVLLNAGLAAPADRPGAAGRGRRRRHAAGCRDLGPRQRWPGRDDLRVPGKASRSAPRSPRSPPCARRAAARRCCCPEQPSGTGSDDAGRSSLGVGGGRPLELWGGVECTVNRVGDAISASSTATAIAARPTTSTASSPRPARDPLSGAVGDAPPRTASTAPTGAWPTSAWRRCAARHPTRSSACVHHGSGPRTPTCSTRPSPTAWPNSPARWPTLSLGRGLDAGQRAADHGALQRPVRRLVPARPRRRAFVVALLNQCRATVLAMRGDPPGQPARPAWSRPTTWAAPTARRSWRRRSTSTTSAAGWPGTCSAAASTRRTRCGTTCRPRRRSGGAALVRRAKPARPTSSASTTTSPASAGSTIGSSAMTARLHGGPPDGRFADIESVRALATPSPGIGPL